MKHLLWSCYLKGQWNIRSETNLFSNLHLEASAWRPTFLNSSGQLGEQKKQILPVMHGLFKHIYLVAFFSYHYPPIQGIRVVGPLPNGHVSSQALGWSEPSPQGALYGWGSLTPKKTHPKLTVSHQRNISLTVLPCQVMPRLHHQQVSGATSPSATKELLPFKAKTCLQKQGRSKITKGACWVCRWFLRGVKFIIFLW